jgi:hypothetical protein
MPAERRLADLADHPVTITVNCGCTRVISAPVAWFLDKFGPDATMEMGERRMRCETCKQRPKLFVRLNWEVSGGRDRRRPEDRLPLPPWVVAG